MKNLHKSVGIFSLSMVAAATAVYIYSPVIGSHADTSATADINLNVGEVLNLTLDTNSLDLSTTINSFVSGTINATASTNSQYGYTLTLEDVDSNTNLVHTNENIDATVASNFSGSKTSSEMEDNTWGFSLNTTDFYKVPVNGSPVALKRTNVPMATESETTAVTFGAKVGNLTSGTYTDSVLFTMYVNGQDGKPTNPNDPSNPPTDPDDPGYEGPVAMQSFSCSRLSVNDTATVIDTRDNNTYTVKKLIDNKCWMMENLRIIDKTITSEDSNLPDGESFTIPASSISSFTDFNYSGPYDADGAYYNDTYGGYYSFYTATAGWAVSTAGAPTGNSPKDICPKGWRLPTGGNESTETSEYWYLHEAYTPAEFTAALNPAYSGEIINNTVNGAGEYVNYYTSLLVESYGDRFNYLMFAGAGWSGVDSGMTYQFNIGNPIRCIAP